MTMTEATTLFDAFVRYAYNVEFGEFSELFEGGTADYLLEKYKLMQQDLGAFYGALDGEHCKRLVQLVVARHARTSPAAALVVDECACGEGGCDGAGHGCGCRTVQE